MTLPQARRRVWTFRLVGWAVLAFAVLVLVLVFSKHLYLNLPGGLIFQVPGRQLHDFINRILATSPILSYIRRITPTVDNQFLYFGLMSFIVWVSVGGLIVRVCRQPQWQDQKGKMCRVIVAMRQPFADHDAIYTLPPPLR
jgi:hypothetical protein